MIFIMENALNLKACKPFVYILRGINIWNRVLALEEVV